MITKQTNAKQSKAEIFQHMLALEDGTATLHRPACLGLNRWPASIVSRLTFLKLQFSHIKKRQSVKFPLDLSIGKNWTYKLKRAIDRPMVIRISESGKLFLVESGIQDCFLSWNPESWALELDDWNLDSPVWTPESKTVLSCVFVWLVLFNRVCFPWEFELPGFCRPTGTGSIIIIDSVIQIWWISKTYLPFASFFKLILFFVNSLGL